jgi:hypothetical protein
MFSLRSSGLSAKPFEAVRRPGVMSTTYIAPASKLASALRMFLLVSICGLVVMSFSTGRRFLERRRIVNDWPTVAATVQTCILHEDVPFRSDGGGVLLSVHCTLHYGTGGREITATVTSSTLRAGHTHGTALSIRDRGVVINDPYSELTAWERRHRVGTPLTVHVDPERPDHPTFVGLGEPVDIDPVPGSITISVMFAVIGLGAWWGANRLDAKARATPS